MEVFRSNIWLISIRQAFLNLLPYFIMIGSTILVYQILLVLNYKENIFYEIIYKILNLYSFTTPLIISTSVSYFLSKNFDLNRISIPTLNFLLFVFFYWEYKDIDLININLNLNFLMIIIPILAVYIFNKTYLLLNKYYKMESLNNELEDVFRTIIPFLVTFIFCSVLMKTFLKFTIYSSNLHLADFFINFPIELITILYLFLTSLIWWVSGIHGTNLLISFFGEDYLKYTIVGNLDANILINNFAIFGGSGATLGLIVAILLFVKNNFIRKIALISLPFAIFNINEILLFALPIVLNHRLLFPFLFVPISNFFIAYLFFYLNPISNPDLTMSWITPIFISGYLVEGNLTYVFLQLIQLSVGVLIYLPFIKKYEKYLNINESQFNNFKNSLKIDEHVEKTQHVNFIKTQADIVKEEKEVISLTNELSNGEFLLYYQPKIDLKNSKIDSYEALLRFKRSDGSITGPYFIDKIEEIGFEKIIDYWLINEVKKDLIKWSKLNHNPKISINISPQSICDENVINKIIKDLKGFRIDVEILERTFAKKMSLFINNIEKLKKNGFTISVDDFGSGFSSLQYLNILPANTIKLDRALILNTKTNEGKILYKSISSMCQLQGFNLVAEGIETKEEIELVKQSNINIVQGFYFSKAIAFDEVINFEKSFN